MTDKRTSTEKRAPNRLTELERQRIINTVNSPEYGHLPASKIVPKLLDNGIWIASESSFYRVMKAHNLLTHREKVKPTKPMKKPRAFKALNALGFFIGLVGFTFSRCVNKLCAFITR